jgi:small GTP-binding protein
MKYILNCILIGNSICGKSSFSKVLTTGKNIIDCFVPTIGVDVNYKSFILETNEYRVKFWDLSGNHRFISILKPYIEMADIILLFYSYDNYISRNDLNIWEDLIKLHNKNAKIYLIGSWLDKKYSKNSWYNKNELTILKRRFPYNLYEINCKKFNQVNTTILSILKDYKLTIKDNKDNICNKKSIILNTKTSDDSLNRNCFYSWLSCLNPK